MNITALSHTALTDLAVITLTGTDATSFLQSQLTQDVAALSQDRAALAGFCTARGRLLASMLVVQKGPNQSDGWLLLTKADAALSFGQRLRMFVLRANVDVTISNTVVVGVRSQQAAQTYTVERNNAQIWISAPSHDNAPDARWWLIDVQNPETPPEDADIQASDADIQAWQADDIAAGLPWIQAATQEAFIPQTINMDLINGISFTKGCYPGQEVVARSHYRGTIKRRMAYATGTAVPLESVTELIGVDTFDANRPGRPCGRVINAAVGNNTLHVLFEVQLGDLDSADFRLGSDTGPVISVSALPYSIQAAEVKS